MDETYVYKELIGKTVTNATQPDDDVLIFTFDDGSSAEWYHAQVCCEYVVIDDVNGNWDDIIGAPLLVCEERVNYGPDDDDNYDSNTWTFYTYRTIKGSVDVKWHGSSNGYYSESVNFKFKEST